MIPQHARPLFWDSNADAFEPTAFPRYAIARVLEHGTEEDVAWLLRVFRRPAIVDVLRTERRLSQVVRDCLGLVLPGSARPGGCAPGIE